MGDSNCFALCDRHWSIGSHLVRAEKIARVPVLELACDGVMLQDRTHALLKD